MSDTTTIAEQGSAHRQRNTRTTRHLHVIEGSRPAPGQAEGEPGRAGGITTEGSPMAAPVRNVKGITQALGMLIDWQAEQLQAAEAAALGDEPAEPGGAQCAECELQAETEVA